MSEARPRTPRGSGAYVWRRIARLLEAPIGNDAFLLTDTRRAASLLYYFVLACHSVDFRATHKEVVMPDPSTFSSASSLTEFEQWTVDGLARDDSASAESRYREALNATSDAFCVVEVVFDDHGVPADVRFIEVNPAFKTQTGISHAVGRLASALFPGLEEGWYEVYGRVALTGQRVHFTRESKALNRIYEVHAFPVDAPELRHVGVLFSDITSRVREAEAHRISREMLATVIQHIPAAVCVIRGSDLRVALVNPAYQAIAPAKEMIGKTLDELWPDSRRDLRSICLQVLESGEAFSLVDDPNTMRRSDDGPLETACFSWSLHRIRLPGDEGWGLLNASWDTTARKQVEDALRTSELRYRLLADQMPDGIFVTTSEGRCIDVNPAGCALFGMSRDELLSCSFRDLLVPEEYPRIPYEVGRLDDGSVARSEWTYRRKDGSTFIGELSGRRNADGNLQGVLRDVTEARRVQDALRESEQRFRLMVEDVPLIVWVHNAKGELEFVNRTYCEFFGITRDQALDDYWRMLTHPDDAAEFFACLEERRPFHAHARIKRADGELRRVESWGHPRFAGDQFLGIVGISVDITTRLAAEEALKEADRRKDEFLAMLAHELRNPLAPLRTGLELLQLAKTNEDVAERVRAMMQRQLTYMVRLIDDLLDVSRIARGKLELRHEAIDVAEVLKGALETTAPALEAGRHEVKQDIPAGLRVEGDAVRLTQVFSNLLNNAARYTPPGGHISLSARQDDGEVVLVVQDDGVGIPADMLEQVFEPFTQVEARDRPVHGGLGLGLSLARSLVELHGGVIQAESRGAGHGSRFTVRLPLLQTMPPISADRSAARTASKPRRVLVVDDNVDAADALGELLQQLGHEVRVAYDGTEALAIVMAYRPEVVLLDIGMPVMDGYEVAQRIHLQSLSPSPVLIALTGYGQASDRERTQQAGFEYHVVKPVELVTLQQLFSQQLASSHDAP